MGVKNFIRISLAFCVSLLMGGLKFRVIRFLGRTCLVMVSLVHRSNLGRLMMAGFFY